MPNAHWWMVALRGAFAILFGLIALFMPGAAIGALVLLFAAYMLLDGVLAIIAAVRAGRHHGKWGFLLFEGVADLAAGAIALAFPVVTVVAFIYVMGAWAIVSGILLLSAAFRLPAPHGGWLMGLGGAISILWGILLMAWPFTGALVLTWWMAAYALFFGGALLMLGFRLRSRGQALP